MKKEESLSTQKLKPKAAVYIRVSTAEQAKEGFSLAAQEGALKNYAKTLGYEIYQVYKDEGKSAKDIKHRPALQKLLKEAEENQFNAIFVYKLDRFSRSLKDLILTIEKLKEQGIDFISLQDRIETASASGKLMFHIISSFAEFERDIISERTKFGMAEKARGGGTVTRAPLGYKIIKGKLEKDLVEGKKVEQIFQTLLDTDNSLNQIAKQNNLTTRGLIQLLKNRTYLGEIKFRGSFKGDHKPIISKEIFEKAQQKLEKISLQRQLLRNFNFINKFIVQNDPRYYDSYSINVLSYFIMKKAVIVKEQQIPKIDKPTEDELKKINEPQRIAKYVALTLLREQGFSEHEIYLERNFAEGRPDVAMLKTEREIFIECLSCRVDKVIDYLSQNRELWILTEGVYPWNEGPTEGYMRWFIFKRGLNWHKIFQDYKEKLNKELEKIKNPLDEL